MIEFAYVPSALHIIDNGHTVMVNYAPGSFISVGGKKYELKQFHFHRPSEEKINGKGYEMSLHLVHADQEGNMAVVAVLLEKGQENPVVRDVWINLPMKKEKEATLDNVQVNAAGLLPTDRGYYTYAGSLTTPPCTENVTSFVLKHQEGHYAKGTVGLWAKARTRSKQKTSKGGKESDCSAWR